MTRRPGLPRRNDAHRRLALALVALLMLSLAPRTSEAQPGDMAGIASVRITSQTFDPILPWLKNPEQTAQGDALVVEGKRLLTTADLVKDATLIEVRKFGRYPDYQAHAVLVDYELNLALLRVEDAAFWTDLKPPPLAAAVSASGPFTISRWRSNGRFEQGSGETVDYLVAAYRFGTMELPVMQGSTSMSGLGWSEVASADGKVLGLISSHENQQIEAIPAAVLRLFAQASLQSPYQGFAHRGFGWQRLNQAGFRSLLHLPEDGAGVLIRSVDAGGTGADQLQSGDILMKLGPYTIDPEGQIDHPVFGRMLFTLALNESLDPALPAEIVRGGQTRQLSLKRARFSRPDYRVIPYVFDQAQDFELQGGLVMQELSLNYLRAYGKPWPERAPARLTIEAVLSSQRKKGSPPEKVVFISKVLPDPANLGYEDVLNAIVVTANGSPVRGLASLREALHRPAGVFQVLELMPGEGRGKLVFSASQLEAANKRVRERYNVPDRAPPAAGPVAEK